MNTLLIDAGNSCIKYSYLAHPASPIERHYAPPYSDPSWMATIFAHAEPPQCIVIASVAPESISAQLIRYAQEQRVRIERIYSSASYQGLKNGYAQPASLGVDRWLCLVALWHAQPHQPFIVVDAGTAVTLDAVDASGQHCGGAIFPGFSLMRQALLQNTAQVKGELVGQRQQLGRNTQECVQYGVQSAIIGGIAQMLDDLKQSAAFANAQIYLSGGHAELLQQALQRFQPEYAPNLVLSGMACLMG